LNPRWDDEGRFRIGPLPSGEYELSITLPADLPSFKLPELSVTEGAELDLGDILVPDPGSAEVLVTRADGAPLAEGASVFLVEAGRYHHRLSSEDGIRFTSAPMFPGTYSLRVQARNAACALDQLVEIRAGETTRAEPEVESGRLVQVDFEVPDGERLPRRIRLQVEDEEGRPLLDLEGRAQSLGDREILLILASLPLGTHAYTVTASEGWSAVGDLVVEVGEEPIVRIGVQLAR
jgi:hypothetical protein